MVDAGATEFQSRNGLIWTPFQPVTCLSLVLFQSRNGLIWTAYDTLYRKKGTMISIPQRSDLNVRRRWKWHISTRNFNPATVWFEHYCCRNYKKYYWNISIPQRSDLNSELTIATEALLLYFNPATVWFERRTWWWWYNRRWISIPQRSDLNKWV